MAIRRFGAVLVVVLVAGLVQTLPSSAATPSKVHKVRNSVPGRYVLVDRNGHARGTMVSAAQAELLTQSYEVWEDALVSGADTQLAPPSWGLDRIDQADLPTNRSYSYPSNGSSVTAYVLDTGIRTTHTEFGGRASVGADYVKDGYNGQDCNGHGTHVAGTIGGSTVGVAKGISLVSVRVLNCTSYGYYSDIIQAVDWVTVNAHRPAVANLSISGGYYPPLNAAIERSIASGVSYVVAAGNSNADACNYTPSSARGAVTVGSVGNPTGTVIISNNRSSFSNYGACVDIFAPGVYITSAGVKSDTSKVNMNGTSMASPHVAGAIALWLDSHPQDSGADAQNAILNAATPDRVVNAAGSSNKLLFVG